MVPGSESARINYTEKPRSPLQHLPHFPKIHKRAIKSFYGTNPSEAEILDQGRITLYKASFFIFLYITAHSRRMTGSDFSFDLLKPFLYSFKINKQLKRPFTVSKSSLELTLNAAAEIPH